MSDDLHAQVGESVSADEVPLEVALALLVVLGLPVGEGQGVSPVGEESGVLLHGLEVDSLVTQEGTPYFLVDAQEHLFVK